MTLIAPDTVAEFLKRKESVEPDLALVRKALLRPYARMDGDYGYTFGTPTPNYVVIRTMAQWLAAVSRCYMVLGQPDKALDQLTFIDQLCCILEARPTGKPMTLATAMVNTAVTSLYLHTIEAAIRQKVLQEPQLAALEEQLKGINLLRCVANALETEQAGICHEMEIFMRAESGKKFEITWSAFQSLSIASFMPRGWDYQNMANCLRLQQEVIESIKVPTREIAPHDLNAAVKEVQSAMAHPNLSPFKLLAAIALPTAKQAVRTLAETQTMVNQARIVCALERYRLGQGEYPVKLENLTPRYIEGIPNDVIGGRPPHYVRGADGTFLLYSIGWSETDHGGHSNQQADSDLIWPEE